MLLAAVLSLSGSLGLHPEPATEYRAGGTTPLARAAGQAGPPFALHLCPVCLLHFSVSLPPSGDIARSVLPAAGALVPSRSAFTGLVELRPHEGRAPPAVL